MESGLSGVLPEIESKEHKPRRVSPTSAETVITLTAKPKAVGSAGRVARGASDERHIAPLQRDPVERCVALHTNVDDTICSP
jgi:hypothetical protein